MELFVTIVNSFQVLTIVTKSSILDTAGVLHLTLIIDIFAFQYWILITLKPIFPSYGYQSINLNGKEFNVIGMH